MVMMLSASGCGMVWSSRATVLEPLPVKLSIRSSSVGVAIPLVIEEKKRGGYRSPVEMKVDIEMGSLEGIRAPLKPVGVVIGVRMRW